MLVVLLLLLAPRMTVTQFKLPRVLIVVNKSNLRDLPAEVVAKRTCYIDRGDELNACREVSPMRD